MASSLSLRFLVAPGHRKVVLFTALSFFCLGLPRVVTNATAFALFLREFDASLLPYTYLGASVAAPAVGAAYLWLQRRLSFWLLISVTLGFDIVALTAARIGLGVGVTKPFVMGLTIWVEVEWLIAGLVFWGLAERMFNIRDAKRLFGIIGAGEPAAVILGGAFLAVLPVLIGTENLVFVSAASVLLSILLIGAIRRGFGGDFSVDHGEDEEQTGGFGTFGKYTRYVWIIFSITFIYEVMHFVMDNAFYSVTELRYSDADAVASFIGLFFSAAGVLSLVLSVTLSGWLMRRFGVGFSLLSLPVLVCAASIAALAVADRSQQTIMFFAIVCLTKVLDEGFKNSIYGTAFLTVFQPLPPDLRTRVHAINGSYVEQAAAGVAGAALLGANQLLGFDVVDLMAAIAGLAVVWLVLSRVQFLTYKEALGQAIGRRFLGEGAITLADSDSLSAVERRLSGTRPGEVLYAMVLLEAHAPQRLAQHLAGLFSHPSPDVRAEAFRSAGRGHLTQFRDMILDRIAAETRGEVKSVALISLAAIDESHAAEHLRPYLDDPDRAVQRGAYTGLMRHGGMEGVLQAGERFLSLLRSHTDEERRLGAFVLDDLASPQFYRPLITNIQSGEPHLQRLALRTAGRILAPQLKGVLLTALSDRRLGGAAAAAVVPLGAAVLSDLGALHDSCVSDEVTRGRFAMAIARIGGAKAAAILADRLSTGSLDDRFHTARALHAMPWDVAHAFSGQAWQAVEDCIAATEWLAGMRTATDTPSGALIESGLRQAQGRQRERLLLLLGTVLPRAQIEQAAWRLGRGNADDRGYALEVIDTLLPRERKVAILPILDSEPVASADAAVPVLAAARALVDTSGPGGTVWLRRCAALAVAAASGSGSSENERRDSMLTIEKIMTLRSVSIFADVPDQYLADVAEVLREVEVDPGKTLIREGEMGTELYIVVEGRFGISRKGTALTELAEGDVVGELSLFDPEPRSATVTALAPSRVFALGHEHLDDLMASNVAIANAFVRLLAHRLRETTERAVGAGAVAN